MSFSIGTMIHLASHFLAPLAVAPVVFRSRWRLAALVMMATIVVDLDHLAASPMFDPARCSIGFHPLHTWPAIIVYSVLILVPHVRVPALGLLIHMALDGLDCAI